MLKFSKLIMISICVTGLTACETMREYTPPMALLGAEKTDLTALGNARFEAAEPVIAWWETLEDPVLNDLIDHALDRNKDVAISLTRVLEARAVTSQTGFDRYPTVTSNASYQRNRLSEETGTPVLDRSSNQYQAGFDALWELDLFGRVSSRIRGDEARVDIAQDELHDAYVTIAAEVTRSYIQLRGAQYRLDIAQRNADNQKETYVITRRLTEGGRGTQLDVSRALTQLDLTQSTIPAFEAEVAAAIHRLSVLTGQVPDAQRENLSQWQAMPSIPVVVNLGNVSELVRRRPDISAAESSMVATTADYNVTVANQFPVVNIVGSLGFVATSLSDFGSSALASSIGPSVNWAAFDMGRVRAQIDQNDARAQRAVLSYEKTVLEALEEVQTAVSDFSREEQRRALLQDAARSSKEAAGLARQRYEAGIDTFIDVLEAEGTQLETEDRLAQSEINAALDLISIYKALGGGWQIPDSVQ